ncbi:MAG: SPOR domain-containing protein, partial [Gemmatimonadaceae bacterium]|nr:SPOR domain-containing protein [Gemmatimonadaceae bacterium]
AGSGTAEEAAADSEATPYSVVLADVSSVTGANGELDQASSRGFPAVSFSPYPRADGALSYVVISGAFPDSAGADSLLRAVRAKRYRKAAAAHVVRLPYAVLIQKGVSQDQASMFVRAYLSKGLPVYPLLQADGSASLWAGAFRTAEQAQPLVTSFRANGDQPTVTIRTGRPF